MAGIVVDGNVEVERLSACQSLWFCCHGWLANSSEVLAAARAAWVEHGLDRTYY